MSTAMATRRSLSFTAFLLCLLLQTLFAVSANAQNTTTGINGTTTLPSPTPTPGQPSGSANTVHSTVALFGALVAATLFSM